MLTPSVGGVYAISVTAPGRCRGVRSSAHGMISIYTQRECTTMVACHEKLRWGDASHVPYVCFFFLHPDGLNARGDQVPFRKDCFCCWEKGTGTGT